MSFSNFALETFLSSTCVPLLHIPLSTTLHHTQTTKITTCTTATTMTTQVQNPANANAGTNAANGGWSAQHIAGIRTRLVSEMQVCKRAVTLPLDNTMPRDNDAANHLARALG